MPLSGSTPLTSIHVPSIYSTRFASPTTLVHRAHIASVSTPTILAARAATIHLRLNNARLWMRHDLSTSKRGNSALNSCVHSVHCRCERYITPTTNSLWVATRTNCSPLRTSSRMVNDCLLHRSHNMVFTLGLRHTFAVLQRSLALVQFLEVHTSLASFRAVS